MPSGKLEVELIGATGLKSSDWFGFGKSDHYAVVSCNSQRFESAIAKEGSDPNWNQSFVFNIDEETKNLFVKVYDKDRVVGSDDFIGTARVPLDKVLEDGEQPETLHDVVLPSGKSRGQVKVAMKFTPA